MSSKRKGGNTTELIASSVIITGGLFYYGVLRPFMHFISQPKSPIRNLKDSDGIDYRDPL